jgi:copper chaperone NosL
MAVSDRRFAGQIVAPGEEPAFFDDLGCLREYLADRAVALPRGAIVFVADHRTSEWVDARAAVFTRRTNVATPMASGLMAHRDASSRDLDPDARGGMPVAARDVLGSRAPAGER